MPSTLMWRCPFGLTVLLLCMLGNSDALPKDLYPDKTGSISLENRGYRPIRGTRIIESTCPGADLTIAQQALGESYTLARAGLDATASFSLPPFNTFFPPTLEAANTVAGVYRRVLHSLSSTSSRIDVICQDKFQRCKITDSLVPLGGSPSYTAETAMGNRPALMVLCPLALKLSPTPRPCSRRPGGIYLGWAVLQAMVSISSISGSGLAIRDTSNNVTAAAVMTALAGGQNTTTSAAAYAHLGTWAREVGLGASLRQHQRSCVEQYRQSVANDSSDVVG